MASRAPSRAESVLALAAPMTTESFPFAKRSLMEIEPSSAGSSAMSSSFTTPRDGALGAVAAEDDIEGIWSAMTSGNRASVTGPAARFSAETTTGAPSTAGAAAGASIWVKSSADFRSDRLAPPAPSPRSALAFEPEFGRLDGAGTRGWDTEPRLS